MYFQIIFEMILPYVKLNCRNTTYCIDLKEQNKSSTKKNYCPHKQLLSTNKNVQINTNIVDIKKYIHNIVLIKKLLST